MKHRFSPLGLGLRKALLTAGCLSLSLVTTNAYARDTAGFSGTACLLFSEPWFPFPQYLSAFETVRQTLELKTVLGFQSADAAGCSDFIVIMYDTGGQKPAIGLNDVTFARMNGAKTGIHQVSLWRTLGPQPASQDFLVDYRQNTLRVTDAQGQKNDALLQEWLTTSDATVVSDGQGKRFFRILSFGDDGEQIAMSLANLSKASKQSR